MQGETVVSRVHPIGFEPITFGSVDLVCFPYALLMLAKAPVFRGFCFYQGSTTLPPALVFAHLWGDKWGELTQGLTAGSRLSAA